jgi:hypothetical protein
MIIVTSSGRNATAIEYSPASALPFVFIVRYSPDLRRYRRRLAVSDSQHGAFRLACLNGMRRAKLLRIER